MSKLAIYQGDALDREVDLDRRNLRLGRAENNDVVLPDPTQAVSRLHAELRYESGGYVLYDLNSPNGIWVANRRHQKIALEPDQPVTIGPYTLIVRETPEAGPYVGREPAGTAPQWDDTYVAAGNRQRSAGPPRQPGPPSVLLPSRRSAKPLVFGLFALVIVLAFLGSRFLPGNQVHSSPPEPVAPSSAAVPTPRLAPEDQRAPREVSETGQPAAAAIVRSEPRPAADDRDAAALARQKEARRQSATPTPGPDSGSSQPVRGQDPRPATSSSPTDDPLWTQYESARNTLQHGSIQAALTQFCQIDLSYRDVKDEIEKIGNAIRANVPKVIQDAEKLEKAGELYQSFQQYDLAAQWNRALRSCPWAPHNDWETASTIVESSRRVRDRMTQEGEEALRQANANYAQGKPQARAGYEKAFRYLADDHPKKKEIKERLDELAGK